MDEAVRITGIDPTRIQGHLTSLGLDYISRLFCDKRNLPQFMIRFDASIFHEQQMLATSSEPFKELLCVRW
jgi:hypothetical protein